MGEVERVVGFGWISDTKYCVDDAASPGGLC